MLRIDDNLQVPIVVTQHKNGRVDIDVPDFSITIHGEDFVQALSDAILKTSAIYYYNLERNVKFNLTTTYEEASALCDPKKQSFPTYMCLTT